MNGKKYTNSRDASEISIIQVVQNEYTPITPEVLHGESPITLEETRTTTTDRVVEDEHWYAFDGQRRTYYTVTKQINPTFGTPTTTTQIIENRHGSELTFIISTEQSINVRTTQDKVTAGSTTYTAADLSFAPKHESICDFIRKGDSVTKLHVPPSKYTENAEGKILDGKNIQVQTARIAVTCPYDTGESHVTYTDSEFSIDCEPLEDTVEYLTRDQTRREYVTQLIESTFHSSKKKKE